MKPTTFVLFVFLSLCICRAARCEPNEPIKADVVRLAAQRLLGEHFRQGVDRRELSLTWAREYLLALDPRRMHFLASDEKGFLQQAERLLEDAENGKTEFPLLVARRFRTRFDANATRISKLLNEKHDFTLNESVRIDHEAYPANKATCDERWRLRIKHELLIEDAKDPNARSARDFLRGRYSRIEKHVDSLTPAKLQWLYIDSLARSLDPHSAYYDEDFLVTYRIGVLSNYTIGLPLVYRNGDLWIQSTPREISYGKNSLAAYRIVAVRVKGHQPVHLTGLSNGSAIRTLISPAAELGSAKAVILDLDHPRLGQRRKAVCDRWPRRHDTKTRTIRSVRE